MGCFFLEKLLRPGGGGGGGGVGGQKIKIAVCEGGIHVSVYMHVNVRNT